VMAFQYVSVGPRVRWLFANRSTTAGPMPTLHALMKYRVTFLPSWSRQVILPRSTGLGKLDSIKAAKTRASAESPHVRAKSFPVPKGMSPKTFCEWDLWS